MQGIHRFLTQSRNSAFDPVKFLKMSRPSRFVSGKSTSSIEGNGQGEWIRTIDLLFPNRNYIINQQLTGDLRDCDPLLQAPTAQGVSEKIDLPGSNPSQRLDAVRGHNFGHSPTNDSVSPELTTPALTITPGLIVGDRTPGAGIPIDSIVQEFLAGRRPEEIQAHQPTLQLSEVYAVITLYLEWKETALRLLQHRRAT